MKAWFLHNCIMEPECMRCEKGTDLICASACRQQVSQLYWLCLQTLVPSCCKIYRSVCCDLQELGCWFRHILAVSAFCRSTGSLTLLLPSLSSVPLIHPSLANHPAISLGVDWGPSDWSNQSQLWSSFLSKSPAFTGLLPVQFLISCCMAIPAWPLGKHHPYLMNWSWYIFFCNM